MAQGPYGRKSHQIMQVLLESPAKMQELVAIVGTTPQNVAQRVQMLRGLGMIKVRRYRMAGKGKGRRSVYSYTYHALRSLEDVLSKPCPACKAPAHSTCWAGTCVRKWPHRERFLARMPRV